jgi:thiamine transport system permease protein
MAGRIGTLRPPVGAALVAALLGAMTLGTVAVVALHAGAAMPGAADWAAVRFTVTQAALSAVISGLLAVPVARALARRRFAGRGALITLMGAPFLLPVIVAVLGLLAIFGRAGVMNDGLAALGLPRLSIYGLHGVVLAHVFLNLPLATRMLLLGWQAIPAERFRLAQSLDLTPGAQFRHLEAPMLQATLPGAMLTVFTICLASFAVALTLGGGPAATTVELAIYQALRFDFAPGRAATLAMLQFALCLTALALGWSLIRDTGFGTGLGRRVEMPAPGGWRKGMDVAAIALAAGFLMLPLGALVIRGLTGMDDLPGGMLAATLRSVLVALATTVLVTGAALVLALAAGRRAAGHRLFDAAATLPLAASSLVIGTGLFLALRGVTTPSAMALPVTIAVNATLALPYAYRLLLPEARALHQGHDRLAQALGLTRWARFRLVTLPCLARPLGFGAGITAALSMGDLGVITLFAAENNATLPLFIHGLMGSYRMEAAAAAALILMGISFALFALFDGIGRHASA